MLPTVVIVGADKGGVGKTTVTRALADYLAERQVAATFFDSQYPAGNLCRFVPASTVIDIASVRDQMKVFDAVEGVTVLDVCAGLLSPTLRALDQAGLLAEVRAGALNLALLHVLGENVASLSEIADTTTAIGKSAKHFLVKNHTNKGGFALESDPRFAEHFRQMQPRTIAVPYLDVDVYREVERDGVSFAAFVADAGRSRIQRGYLRDWLTKTFAEFDRVGLKDLIAG